MKITYGIHEISPLGRFVIARCDKGLCAMGFGTVEDLQQRFAKAELIHDQAGTMDLAQQAVAAWQGQGAMPPLDLSSGTQFQQKVWRALLAIPFGATCSYGDIARVIGNPKACRAVGSAVGVNPIVPLIPCHRVIKGDGTLGNYGYGPAVKRRLLMLENVSL